MRRGAVLNLRDGLRAGVLALIRALAEAAVPETARRARDRQRDDVERRRWSAMRRDGGLSEYGTEGTRADLPELAAFAK